jgi:hypothetical protein
VGSDGAARANQQLALSAARIGRPLQAKIEVHRQHRSEPREAAGNNYGAVNASATAVASERLM